jgi:3-phenylpropionate/cinnamic acid dioxygenase small subunit
MPVTAASLDLTADLYCQIQQFYARQMQLLDDGDAGAWAGTFAPDGVFAANAHPQPTRGRDAIAAAARRAVDELAADGETRRHWLGMLAVDPRSDGSIGVRSYALIFQTRRGGQAALRLSTVCDDVLVQGDAGDWLIRYREVTRDDLPSAADTAPRSS